MRKGLFALGANDLSAAVRNLGRPQAQTMPAQAQGVPAQGMAQRAPQAPQMPPQAAPMAQAPAQPMQRQAVPMQRPAQPTAQIQQPTQAATSMADMRNQVNAQRAGMGTAQPGMAPRVGAVGVPRMLSAQGPMVPQGQNALQALAGLTRSR